jgi:hypothetical protein
MLGSLALIFNGVSLLAIGLAKASILPADPRKFGHLDAVWNDHDATTSHLSLKVRKIRIVSTTSTSFSGNASTNRAPLSSKRC